MNTPFEHAMASSRNTPRTPRTMTTPKQRHHHKYDVENIPSQNFKVGYQKVTLDIDLAEQSIIGEAELTILPQDSALKEIKLDCRGMQIRSIIINQRKASYRYNDFFQNDEYLNNDENPVLSKYDYNEHYETNSKDRSIEQHHLYRAKFYPLYSDQNNTFEPKSSFPESTSELIIRIPDSIKLRLQSSSKSNFSPAGTTRSIHGTPITTNTLMSSDKVYTPLTIKIHYVVKNSKNGILFHGGKHTNIPKNKWFCYTYNNDIGCSASSWVPCIDNFYEKPAWDINIIVPKTIGDIGETKIIGTKAAEKALRKLQLEEMDEDDANDERRNDQEQQDEDDEDDEKVDESTPIVVAVPDVIRSKESPHTLDIGKKVVNFQFYDPVSAHHLGFAVGPFEKTPMMEVKPDSDELIPSTNLLNSTVEGINDPSMTGDANSNKVPTMIYHFPGRRSDVINSTIFIYKAFEYYSKEFGSFPFASYTLVFVEDLSVDFCGFAGLTLASDRLLYSPDLIEPIFETTELLSVALAEQYSGINVLPKTLNDYWLVIGLAHYMAIQFIKKLFGFNHYKYLIKKRMDLVCDLDVGRRPLANQLFRFPINTDQDFEFIRLKSPLVLLILDRRMTKTDKSFGLSRVIPKLFLQAMSNDLVSGNCLSTAHFQHVCDKVARHKLEEFFRNWVFNSGVPTLRVTQKFNRKRMMIEMSIRQTQKGHPVDRHNDDIENPERDNLRKCRQRDNFVDEANKLLSDEQSFDPQYAFTGPITIRIHEADGTPYEHIVDIKDQFTKLDIQYNTKYRRIKRKKLDGGDEGEEKEVSKKSKSEEDAKVKTLGDLLLTSFEMEAWNMKEDEKPDENTQIEASNDAFEWIRIDADFEWIANIEINQQDQMFESQLRQDRDVEAQLESAKYFSTAAKCKLNACNALLRTLLDKRYFYGVRVEAAKGLSKLSKEEIDHLGMRYLLKAFKKLYCYNGKINKNMNDFDPFEYLPLPNDFSNFSELFVKKAIIEAMSNVTNKRDGDTPIELKRIMLNILKYNDNMNNVYNDCFYVSLLISCITNLIINTSNRSKELFIENHKLCITDEIIFPTDVGEKFAYEAIIEMNRCLQIDQWSPSFQNIHTRTIISEKIRLAKLGIVDMSFSELLSLTKLHNHPDIRISAFEGLLALGGLKNSNILSLFFLTLKLETSHYIKYKLQSVFLKSIGIAALEGTGSKLDDEEFFKSYIQNGNGSSGRTDEHVGNQLVIVDDDSGSNVMQSRRDQIARTSLKGAIGILRRDYSIGKALRKELWEGIHSCLLPINTKRNLFDAVTVLFEALDKLEVVVDLPQDKRVVAKVETKKIEENSGTFVISFKREGRLKIQLPAIKIKHPSISNPPVSAPHNVTGTANPAKLPAASITQSPVSSKPILKLKPLEATSTSKSKVSHSTHKPAVLTSPTSIRIKGPKLSLTPLKPPAPPSTPAPKVKREFKKLVTSHKTKHKFEVKLHLPPSSLRKFKFSPNVGIRSPIVRKRVKYEVIRNNNGSPLRFVKLNLVHQKVTVCTDESFKRKHNHNAERVDDEHHIRTLAFPHHPNSSSSVKKIVTLKIKPNLLKSLNYKHISPDSLK